MLVAVALICVPVLGCGTGQARLQSGHSVFDAIKQRAESYLNDSGKELARGRTDGALVYSVSASVDPAGMNISGEEQVLYTNRTPDNLSQVVFRAFASDAGTGKSLKPAVISDQTANEKKTTSSLDGSILSVKVPDGIKPGGQTVVGFSFSESVPPLGQEDTDGLYAHSDGTFDLGSFLPTVLTYSNGAWDKRDVPSYGDSNYYDSAFYSVSIKAPGGYTVAAPGVEDKGPGGANVFVAGPVRDFEAQVSNRYVSAGRTLGQTTVTSYYYDKDSRAGKEALDSGCQALTLYSQHFGPYPYRRLNVCEAPIVDDGMEYTGQPVIGSFLYESKADAEELDVAVAHEVCHQWWAMGVGSDSIGAPWLDESLTSYCEVLYSLWRYGDASARAAVAEMAGYYLSMREQETPDAAVDLPVSGFESDDQYTAIVYGKGALFFNELRKALDAPAFDKSLSEYYRKNVFHNATAADLLTAFRDNSGGSGQVDALYQRWAKELHGDEDVTASPSL